MSKQEVRKRLEESGLIHRFKNEKLWQMAFDLYNAETKSKLKPNCGTCYKKVKEWLMRD